VKDKRAFDAGGAARRRGLAIEANPYSRALSAIEYLDWAAGWWAADVGEGGEMETLYQCSYCGKQEWFSPDAEKMSAGARCCACFTGFFGKPNDLNEGRNEG